MSLNLNYKNVKSLILEEEIQSLQPEVTRLHDVLEKGQGLGNEFLGWLHLPSQISKESINEIKEAASKIQNDCDVFICIGIGGSYLGAQAAYSFCLPTFYNQIPSSKGKAPQVYFAGHNISSDYLNDLLQIIEGKDICINVVSKSGTTTEPAISFRVLKEIVETKYGFEKGKERIFVTTDGSKGALRSMADSAGYRTFVIPDDVGGRYSVLTPVGLLPIAVSGIDIEELLEGARDAEALASKETSFDKNPAYLYAAIRHLLYLRGKHTEVLATFHPALHFVAEWWKQLTGESEGKNSHGIYPSSVEYTTDLHSMGQWIQEGNRFIFETFLWIANSNNQMEVPLFKDDVDGLNYLAGKSLDYVNLKAYEGTSKAHLDGGVPNMTWVLPNRSPYTLGQLFYLFQRAIAISGYLMRVNPFNQPGVEYYKKNMFQLLEKPGYSKGESQ